MPDHVSEISFDSLRAPMWGDFYAKSGAAAGTQTYNYVYNQGLASHTAYSSSLNFIAVPDTVQWDSSVPEPIREPRPSSSPAAF